MGRNHVRKFRSPRRSERQPPKHRGTAGHRVISVRRHRSVKELTVLLPLREQPCVRAGDPLVTTWRHHGPGARPASRDQEPPAALAAPSSAQRVPMGRSAGPKPGATSYTANILKQSLNHANPNLCFLTWLVFPNLEFEQHDMRNSGLPKSPTEHPMAEGPSVPTDPCARPCWLPPANSPPGPKAPPGFSLEGLPVPSAAVPEGSRLSGHPKGRPTAG